MDYGGANKKNTAISFVFIEILRTFAPEVREKDSWTMLNSRSNCDLDKEILEQTYIVEVGTI